MSVSIKLITHQAYTTTIISLTFSVVHVWNFTYRDHEEEGSGLNLKAMDAEQLREQAHIMVDFIADYYKTIESFPVLSQVQVLFLLLPTFSFSCD